MALQSLQINATVAMRARDVSRPTREQQEAADRRPLRDETQRGQASARRRASTSRPGEERQGSGGS
ncbi:hypothetical protein [Streptosporangium sp. NPDC000239]|uniref:Uncharacterized protein n=1 Tax=Streptosporangium jomthongense TaxID=1193683 RepID=A0ABV8ESG5_9ACTN